MKLRSVLFLLTLASTAMLYTSCKKTETYGKPTTTPTITTVDQAQIASTIGMNLYSTLSVKLSGNQGLKVSGVTKLTTMGINPTCGSVVSTPTNFTTHSGDTTSTYTGNSVFTYQCNGTFNNSTITDAYILADTLEISQTGSDFANHYRNTQNYVVKAVDTGYRQVSVAGSVNIVSNASKFKSGSPGTPTAFYQLSCEYILHDITVNRTGNSAEFTAGAVDFLCQKLTVNNGTQHEFQGTVLALPDHILEINVRGAGGDKLYDLNTQTGQITTVR
jgi:hypothetical protein